MTAPAPSPSVNAALPPRRGRFHSLTVQEVERLTPDAVAITFRVPEELRDDYAFLPGQHVTVRRKLSDGGEVRRNYSICAPATSGRLRIAVKRLDGGAFSAFANTELRPGDEVDVMTPTGRFTVSLDPANAKHYCAFAAGSGITPVLSILTTALEVEPASVFTLVYGNRTTRSVMFLDELADLKDRHPTRLRLIHVLSREPQEVELFSGRIDREKVQWLLDALVPAATVDDWFLCGPLPMLTEVRSALMAAGVDRDHISAELFHVDGEPVRPVGSPSARAAELGASTVTVVLDGRSSTFSMPRDGLRILDATLAVRSDAPYACKGGVCGTCRAQLVAGEVTMDQNYALERDELEAGFVLACQSRPVSGTVVLDFDT